MIRSLAYAFLPLFWFLGNHEKGEGFFSFELRVIMASMSVAVGTSKSEMSTGCKKLNFEVKVFVQN